MANESVIRSGIYVLGSNSGIGGIDTTTRLNIKGIDNTSSNYSLKIESASASSLLSVRNDGIINAGIGTNLKIGLNVGDYGSGTGNTSLGYNTLQDITSGYGNTVIGSNAGTNISTGFDNIAIGISSLVSNVSGTNNIAIGRESLLTSTGAYNVAIGSNSIRYNTTGGNNTGVGRNALQYTGSGNNNTAIGSLAGTLNSGSSNIFIGYASGNYLTASSNRLFIDNQDRANASGDEDNSLVTGIFASLPTNQYLRFNANVGIGITASARLHIKGIDNTSSNYSLKIESASASSLLYIRNDGVILAGQGGVGSTYNLKIGQDIGNLSSGGDNVHIGYQSGKNITSAASNTSVGSGSLTSITIGSQNVAYGVSSLSSNLIGHYNTAIGYNALLNYTGNGNTGIGYRALNNATSGDDCVAVGKDSLFSNSVGARNTALGVLSGFTNNAAGGVYIGYAAGFYETAANKLFIDNTLRASEADGRIKSLITGTFNASTTSQYLRFNANVGIGIDATSRLHILGIDNTSNYSLKIESASASSLFNVRNDGYVGIGTASGTTILHVYGTQSGAFRLQDTTEGLNKVLTSDANGVGTWASPNELEVTGTLTASQINSLGTTPIQLIPDQVGKIIIVTESYVVRKSGNTYTTSGNLILQYSTSDDITTILTASDLSFTGNQNIRAKSGISQSWIGNNGETPIDIYCNSSISGGTGDIQYWIRYKLLDL